jgi:phenylalanyl-tRNA synthetase beta chain
VWPFSGRVVRNVNPKASTPQWMVDRLARCGQRSVTALVDISNYVMFELGRPSHIFDLDKIQGGLDVRWGKAGEQLKLLNGNTVTVDDKVGVIADDVQVESLAGIMGGDATAVSDDTQRLSWRQLFGGPRPSPDVRADSIFRLMPVTGLSVVSTRVTCGAHRTHHAVDHVDICGTTSTVCGPIDDLQVNMPAAAAGPTLRVARASKVIGMPLTQAQCTDALTRLGLPVTQGDGTVTVMPPSYRFDLQIEEDLIEEVARMVGYHNLPQTPPLAPITANIRTEAQRSPFAVRRSLAGMGYQETINFSFVEERWEHELAVAIRIRSD